MIGVKLPSLGQVSTVLGTDVTAGLEAIAEADATTVLTPGTRVCFSGSALDQTGQLLSREDMESMAVERGLDTVGTVTLSRCDVLVVAEPGSQSTKARNALKWGKPVLSVADFLAWAKAAGPVRG